MPNRNAAPSRRAVLIGASAALAGCAAPLRGPLTRGAYPFTLGIASGDPWPDGFVMWTRLAGEPPAIGGDAIEVGWDLARDPHFAAIERSGSATAHAADAHSVHVEIGGLAPARDYWYRFRANGHVSATGRARTAPAPGRMPGRITFVLCGCNNWEQGFFAGYRHIAAEAPDFAFHYGDYIYESGSYRGPAPRARLHDGPMCRTLDDYRRRYAQYKSDPDLQAAHAATSFVMSYDDHEVADNWSADFSRSSGLDPAVFHARRDAALQAWFEHMPLRAAQDPRRAGARMYRSLAFGDLLALDVLDTRRHRTRQPCGDNIRPVCAGMDAPDATMLGPAQEAWLAGRIGATRARWNLLGQQVAMMRIDVGRANYNMDSWAGYTAARGRMHALLARHRAANPVVLSGDWHRNWVGELKADYDDPRSASLAPEFLSTSISSGGDPGADDGTAARFLSDNPHVRHHSDRRGYMSFAAAPGRLDVALRALSTVLSREAEISTIARFAVVPGDPRIHPA